MRPVRNGKERRVENRDLGARREVPGCAKGAAAAGSRLANTEARRRDRGSGVGHKSLRTRVCYLCPEECGRIKPACRVV